MTQTFTSLQIADTFQMYQNLKRSSKGKPNNFLFQDIQVPLAYKKKQSLSGGHYMNLETKFLIDDTDIRW